ncbi:MAG: aldehyde dehydrogenase family protein [Dehalococcoidia bacterium]
MKMYIGSEWVDKAEKAVVRNKYDGTEIDTVPLADAEDVDRAVASAVRGAEVMRTMPARDRYHILRKAAELLAQRQDEFGRTITLEEGKVLSEGVFEASRAVETMTASAEEAKRIHGETVPLDGAPGGANKIGFTMRVPCGVVAAITPFNFPLNLVMHKVAPALAAGNAVIVKPASDTPLSALKLTELLLEAGLPPEAIQCVTGPGAKLGDIISTDPRIRKISFTGSLEIGEQICRMAGIKKVTMELGSNCPLIVMPDADLDQAVQATVASGYANAGQVCISAQRILVHSQIYAEYLELLKPKVEEIVAGDPLRPGVTMGPLIREADAIRVNQWIQEAVEGGARLITGGGRQGPLHEPTVVADVKPEMRISCEELFGPAVAVTPFEDIDAAIALANDSKYGLSAAIFTNNVDWALKFAREVEAGNLHINWGPIWRADLMPYGGLKGSGMGKEGPRYAVEEMTELKMVVFHLT